ncbi:DUF952 domain-containing protein [Fodinicurvata fenggangensis]|uniref:DUF952 domain-containing protein n=1 Tax=Fodinicurvata fenggangensis TaxID=1121830 RepID=UPI00047A15B0|nr:DUF952 domain-containing protein [Fodinicurvata fenggangensis]
MTNSSFIYHVCHRTDWTEAVDQGSHQGSEDDRRDGFIHFSTAAQLRESVAKHRAGQDDLVLLEVAPSSLGKNLKWEASRNGALFPHLHGPLDPAVVRRSWPLPLGQNGSHLFPEDL